MNFNHFIKDSYNKTASEYVKHSDMQTKNLDYLINEVMKNKINLTGDILDLGCGTGVLLDVLFKFKLGLPSSYQGIDLSKEMLAIAIKKHPNYTYHVGEMLEEISKLKPNSIDNIVSNAALHWLVQNRDDKNIKLLFSQCHRVLKPGGNLIVSMGGDGTAQSLLNAYYEVMENHKSKSYFSEEGYLQELFARPRLPQVIGWIRTSNLNPISASINMRPLYYEHPADYIKAVRAYGEKIYTSAVPKQKREQVWGEIQNSFINTASNDSSYRFEQNIVMFIAQKH